MLSYYQFQYERKGQKIVIQREEQSDEKKEEEKDYTIKGETTVSRPGDAAAEADIDSGAEGQRQEAVGKHNVSRNPADERMNVLSQE